VTKMLVKQNYTSPKADSEEEEGEKSGEDI
jgi:hypothetical protein